MNRIEQLEARVRDLECQVQDMLERQQKGADMTTALLVFLAGVGVFAFLAGGFTF